MKIKDIAGLVESDELPPHVKIADRRIQQLLNRGAHRIAAKPSKPREYDRADRWRISLHPTHPRAKAFDARPGRPDAQPGFYDPELADLETLDQDEPLLTRTYARAKSHLSQEVEGLPEKNVIYRGMSAEEYESFIAADQIASKGDYNMGGQDGLTYWTTDVRAAQSYADGFAPFQHKPTFHHPAYVVAAKAPNPADTRRVKGTGEHEVGVTRPITSDEVLAVWRGTVYAYDPGEIELVQHDDRYHTGSGVMPSPRVVWERIA